MGVFWRRRGEGHGRLRCFWGEQQNGRKADFVGIEQFGIETLTAQEFLQQIGVLP
jgi:hypothetical protein